VISLTPSLTDDNWNLRAGAAKSGKILEVWFGGQATTSTGMQTRVARASGQTGSATAGNVEKLHPNAAGNGMGFATTFATTQPTLEAGNLFATSWNAHGGVVRWLAAPGEEFVLIGAATELTIACRNSVGTAVSDYGCVWEED
jgi:hypothetical protein